MTCPVCASKDVLELLDVGEMPILCNELCATREAARDVTHGRVDLGFCRTCGHVYNRLFDGAAVEYSPDYENSLHCSGMFQRYAEGLAERLVARYGLRGKRVVEIGCGQGDFLSSLCAAGDNTGFGFDPSYQDGNDDPRVTIHRMSFGDVEGNLEGDLVCCRHVLEHIERPVPFLQALHAKLTPGTAVFFEVPNALFTLRDGGIWDIIYEHCGYFTPSSLARAFEEAGFAVRELEETFDGQFLVIHAEAGADADATTGADAALEATAAEFARVYREKIARWREVLGRQNERGGPVVAWGAGSKGNTFLNTVGKEVAAIVDINPKKRGKFVAGTGQPILAPAELADVAPSLVVIMNPVYRDEIAAEVERLGLDPELLVA